MNIWAMVNISIPVNTVTLQQLLILANTINMYTEYGYM